MFFRIASFMFAVSALTFATCAYATEPTQVHNPPAVRDHHLEVLAEAGLAWPGSENLSMGSNFVGSLLYVLGRGWAAGMNIDWSRLSWTPQAGPKAHVDTLFLGPEIRLTLNRRGRILPHFYFGLADVRFHQSRKSEVSHVDGVFGVRLGLGLDYRVTEFLRLGISAGLTRAAQSAGGNAMYAEGDPGIPQYPGNLWSLHLGGRAELL